MAVINTSQPRLSGYANWSVFQAPSPYLFVHLPGNFISLNQVIVLFFSTAPGKNLSITIRRPYRRFLFLRQRWGEDEILDRKVLHRTPWFGGQLLCKWLLFVSAYALRRREPRRDEPQSLSRPLLFSRTGIRLALSFFPLLSYAFLVKIWSGGRIYSENACLTEAAA